ncbi:methyl-accepting chemotaxis protein [Pillotina sp. SPG140]|jgi:methyl-accepting chemotaxis protein
MRRKSTNKLPFPLSHSIKFRFVLSFTLFVIAACSIITINALNQTIKIVQNSFSDQGRPILDKALALIDGDKFETLAQTLDLDDPFYEETRLKLYTLHMNSSCKYLYTIARVSRNNYRYIIDGSDEPGGDEFSPLGTEDDIEENHKAYENMEKTLSFESGKLMYGGEWGWAISVYKPILNAQRTVVGIVGVDFDGEVLHDYIVSQTVQQTIFCLGFIALGFGLMYVFLRMIFSPMEKLYNPMERIAEGEGDLTIVIPSMHIDEMGMLAMNFNKFVGKLRDILLAINQTITELNRDSEELRKQAELMAGSITTISFGIEGIRDQATEQTNRAGNAYQGIQYIQERINTLDAMLAKQLCWVEQSSTSIAQMITVIQSISDNIHSIALRSYHLVQSAESGKQTQHETKDCITDMVNRIQSLIETNKAVTRIAARTTILSMNAAIEAAHAGHAGRGFAVVAEEIRGLSETSTEQSKIITRHIKEIEKSITHIVGTSKKSTKSFEHIDQDIKDLSTMIQQVTVSVEGLNRDIQDILGGIKAVNESAQSISEAGGAMKEGSMPVFSEINDLIKNIGTIMEHTELSIQQARELQKVSEQVLEIAGQNDKSTDKVFHILQRFKI